MQTLKLTICQKINCKNFFLDCVKKKFIWIAYILCVLKLREHSQTTESDRLEVFCEKGVRKSFAKFTENTCDRVSFLIKLQAFSTFAKFSKKLTFQTLAKVFTCEFCEILKSTLLYRTPLVTAPKSTKSLMVK